MQSTAHQTEDPFIFQLSTAKPVAEIAGNLADVAPRFKFSVLHSYDFKEILAGKGFPVERKVAVFEICRAPMAATMLAANPSFSVFMPCRIAVYEEDGQTIISTMNMEPVMASIKHHPELYTEAASVYRSIQEMIQFLVD